MRTATATSLSPSSSPAFTVVGSASDGRVAAFQAALARAGWPPARLIDYADVAGVARDLAVSGWVRFESPGREARVRRALCLAGAAELEEQGGSPVVGAELDAMLSDHGRLANVRQMHLGLMRAIRSVRADRYLNDPADIALAFDKSACQAHLRAAGVSAPRQLGVIGSYEELRARMAALRVPRVFVKLRHGSAASGMVAIETRGARAHAWTTTQLASNGRLYNTRRVRRHSGGVDLQRLVDALCAEGVYAEQWVPKAAIDGASCDVRVVVIGGEPTHWVLRTSRTPFTNLHLGGLRRPIAPLREKMPRDSWQRLRQTCRAVAQAFPRSLYLGLDVAVARGFRGHVVLEVNAFGDYIKDVSPSGHTPQDTQLEALCG